MILCGGKGTRLREETEFRPKPLVMVGGKPMLWHIMKLYSYYGFNEFVVCLGYKGDMIKEYFLKHDESAHDFTLRLADGVREIKYHDKQSLGWTITFVDTGLECDTGSRIARAAKHVEGDEEFLVTYGDGIADINVTQLLEHHRKSNKMVTVTGVKTTNPFGVLEIIDNSVVSFVEKPQSRDWTNGGFFVCNKSIFSYLDASGSCVFEQGPLNRLAREGQLGVYKHTGFWQGVDTLKHLEGINALYEKGDRPWMVWEHKAHGGWE